MERDQDIRTRLRALSVFEGPLAALDVEAAPAQPGELFWSWLSEAVDRGLREPHVMTVSTVDADGRPAARVLILKGLEADRWQFASSSESPKGVELATTPWAALTFYWSELGRQVRVRGRVAPADRAASMCDFLARSEGARADGDAEHWTLYDLVADQVEFLQADRNRRHVRLRYLLGAGGAWSRETL
jgi:pyridoxamine 5'-phosphate oxidase